MIKIGRTYIDDEFRWALAPSFGYEESQYMAVLQNGAKVNFRATDEMVDAALKAAGYDVDEIPDPSACFSPEELAEIMAAFSSGFCWIAKDKRGITSAYETKPELEGAYWTDSIGKKPLRLFCDYNCLEEGECMNLSGVFPDYYGKEEEDRDA